MGIVERKEREKSEMKQFILDAAMNLFIEEGFENVSIRRIADKIEYSPATIYLYFKDKDEMLYTLHLAGFELLFKKQKAIQSENDALLRLKKHAEAYVSFGIENPEYYQLMFIMPGPIAKMKMADEWSCGFRSYDLLKENIKDAMDKNLIPLGDIEIAAFAFWSFVHGIVSLLIRHLTFFPTESRLPMSHSAIDYFMKATKK
jgi:AcrR family transcriptional regulator